MMPNEVVVTPLSILPSPTGQPRGAQRQGGTNSYSNAQVLSRAENHAKSNN
jgi:hypothetical protein